jgi:hypothetical protein
MPATIKGVSGISSGPFVHQDHCTPGKRTSAMGPKTGKAQTEQIFSAYDARTSSIGSLVPRTVIWPTPPIHSLKMPLSPVPVASASVAQRIGRQGAHSTNFFLNHTQMDPESL